MSNYPEIRKRMTVIQAKKHHLNFMQHCWQMKDPFIVGLHTRKICEYIDQAVEDFKQGKSTYLRIKVHPRAGKSDLVSRYLPARFIGEFPDDSVMNISYAKHLAESFSRFGMNLVQSEQYRELFPDVRLDRSAAGNWNIKTYNPVIDDYVHQQGQVLASGLTSGINGQGYSLGILDDYISGRADAESSTTREKIWNEFTDSFLMRRAPVSITIVLATQWHIDDIHGRIQNRNDLDHPDYNPDFPQFESLSFPAERDAAESELAKEYPGEYLFLERFSEEHYRSLFGSMSPYSAAALLNCDPVPREGGILNTNGVVWHNDLADFPRIPYFRVWDYAHTSKERTGADPDYTGGTLIGFERGALNPATRMPTWKIWILDYSQFREGAVERDRKIREIANKDGDLVKILVECSVDSKDGYNYLKKQLSGIYSVKAVFPKGDKVQRCTPVEPIFEAGNIHVMRAPWNKVWLSGIQRFDGSGKTHDEMVDNITAGFHYAQFAIKIASRKVAYGRV